jgi:anti-anti-sigma factor
MSEFEISRIPDGTGLKLIGELDVATSPRLTKALLELPGADTQVTLDLAEITFVDSCGIRAILSLAKSANGNGPVILLNPSEAVSRVFEILGLEHHVGIEVRGGRSMRPEEHDGSHIRHRTVGSHG